ncbi:MAG TPA: YARHG domain-containing protein [Spirochaetota bacterium]|nr:YARHG domain-containing protein [Spirochaetota bacterium]
MKVKYVAMIVLSGFMCGAGFSAEDNLRVMMDTPVIGEEYEKYSISELVILRNSIFANYGYVFTCGVLSRYFKNTGWYHPNPEFSWKDMSMTDSRNANELLGIENRKREEYYHGFPYNGKSEFFSSLVYRNPINDNVYGRKIKKSDYSEEGRHIVPRYLSAACGKRINLSDFLRKNGDKDAIYYEVISKEGDSRKIIKIHYGHFE